MQLLGIYINHADDSIKKVLKEKWYNFYSVDTKNFNLEKFIKSENAEERVSMLQESIDFSEIYKFSKTFYDYAPLEKGKNIFLSAIVGKNGAGKSTLLGIFNIIINNFAKKIKDEFPEYNQEYEINAEIGLCAELYYEINKTVYCIKIENENVVFFNSKKHDIFNFIKEDKNKSKTDLEKLSEHIFYTITSNYSLYTDYPDWMQNLYHKNDGYFTPIVLVPYRAKGDIENIRERKLAEKRVQTIALLLYKNEDKKFIENYIPYCFTYELKTENYYKTHKEYVSYDSNIPVSNYKQVIDYKIQKLEENVQFTEIYNNSHDLKTFITMEKFSKIKTIVMDYWEQKFKNTDNEIFSYYCKLYLQYKTLKTIVNYESITTLLKDDNLKESIEKSIIEEQLLNDNNLNYINLKIIMCQRFIEYSYKNIYKESETGNINILNLIQQDEKIRKAKSYHEVFSYLLPDFFDTHFYFNKDIDSEIDLIQLKDMSSGEQHLYNSLSYIIYHMMNAISNENGNKEGKIPYKHFNLIFDEAELYYHPNYQRCFINNLIKLLNRCNLNIQGINISLVTHSPFILSDIPRNSILALESGNISKKLNETLGANVYDLLEHQFFMPSTIGECSRLFFENVIKNCLNKKKINKSEYKIYKQFSNYVGDEYLHSILENIINEKSSLNDIQQQIEFYNNKINELKLLENEED